MPRIKYTDARGKPIPGVTTVIGILDKPALIWWAFSQGQAYERGEIEGLYEKRDKAADAGTHAHALIEHHLKGLPEPSSDGLEKPEREKAESCFLAYLEWERAHEFQVIASECSLVSDLGFGGTLDIGAVVGDLGIVDIKTSKDVYTSMWLQVSAYGHLWNEHNPDNPIRGYHILRLGGNGDFSHHYRPSLDHEWEMFLDCLDIYKRLKETKQKL